MRVFALSDIHVDYSENALWVKQLSNSEYQQDILVLAGDLTDSLDLMAECFGYFCKKFKHVFFVPGNHDLWLGRGEQFTSVDKFDRVMRLAETFGVLTQVTRVNDLVFVPILAWYDFSFGQPSEYLNEAWMDFRRCIWPAHLPNHTAIFNYFMGKNPASIALDAQAKVITFSHFLPRIDVMPTFIPASKRSLYPVLGSQNIDRQVRQMQSRVHIYGHSHVNRCVNIDNVTYVNNAFGYPSESNIARKRLFDVTDSL